MSKNRSAGVVIIRYEKNKPLILMMRAYSYWDFPKGKIEEGEDAIEAAIREVHEESGITKLNFKWGQINIETEPYGKYKKITKYFLAETNEKKVVIMVNPEIGKAEHDEYRWVSFDEANKLAVERIKRVLAWTNESIIGSMGKIKDEDKHINDLIIKTSL